MSKRQEKAVLKRVYQQERSNKATLKRVNSEERKNRHYKHPNSKNDEGSVFFANSTIASIKTGKTLFLFVQLDLDWI